MPVNFTLVTSAVMANFYMWEREELCDFLDTKLLQFISDECTPTASYTTETTSNPTLPELTEKELNELLFIKDFEQH